MGKFEVLKGTADSLPSEQIKINEILSIIRKNFEKYGFRPFDTPIIEYRETLTNKYEDDAEIVQEIFSVKDRGNRELGLRYDLTVPLCRYIASQKQLKLPFKRYAIGKVFRDGPVKPGRLREFTQCDADVIGTSSIAAEAETLKMFFDTYKQIGIDAIIEINSNKILRGALIQSKFKEKDLQTLILSIDKLKKIGKQGVINEIKEKNLDEKSAQDAIKLLSLTKFSEIEKLAKNDELQDGISELKELTSYLENLNVKYRINFSMSRGLAIYTGNIWEAYDNNPKTKVTSSIGSGGRYDKAIGNYIGDGREFPAFGVSFGLVPIIACLENKDDLEKISLTEIVIAPLDQDLTKTALKIAEKIRKTKNAEVCYDFKLKKAFDYAEYIGAQEIAIIGKQDLENGQYTLRNLKTKEEKKIKI